MTVHKGGKNMRLTLETLTVVLLMSFSCYAGEEIKKTGTFSNFFYHEEAGDLLGYEIRIAVGLKGYEGTFQVAEGGPESLILVKDVSIEGDCIKFSVPSEGTFVGKISKSSLEGTLTLESGNKIHLDLKRAKSYWD